MKGTPISASLSYVCSAITFSTRIGKSRTGSSRPRNGVPSLGVIELIPERVLKKMNL